MKHGNTSSNSNSNPERCKGTREREETIIHRKGKRSTETLLESTLEADARE